MNKKFQFKAKLKVGHSTTRPKLYLVTTPALRATQSHFSWKQKLLILLVLASGLLFCTTLYSAGPDILTAQPQEHNFGKVWERSKYAQLNTLAMFLEMYPEHELYFLDRDARFLGQTALLIGEIEGETRVKNRVHFLNVSRKNIKDPMLKDYLKQEGISEESLGKGKKILFVDTGFIGSLPKQMMGLFPNHREQFDVHMIVAAPDDREHRSPFPSTRVFGTEFFELYPNQDILEGTVDVVHSYARLPKSDLRSDFYVKDPNGKILPESSLGSEDPNDGEINPIKTRKYEEDLQYFMRQANHRLLLDKLRREWRTAYQLWNKGDKTGVVNELKRWLNNKGPQGLAMAMDFIEMNHTTRVRNFTVTPDDLDIKRQEFNYNEARLSAQNLPLWKYRNCRQLMHELAK